MLGFDFEGATAINVIFILFSVLTMISRLCVKSVQGGFLLSIE